MNKIDLVKNTIKESNMTIQQWADRLGVHRNQIHRWLKGNTNIRDSNLAEVGKIIGKKPSYDDYNVTWIEIEDAPASLEKDPSGISLDASYIIELQKEKIESQNQEIEQLKKYLDTKPIEKRSFEEVDSDFESVVHIKFGLNGLKRKMVQWDGYETLGSYLHIDKDRLAEYFDMGVWHPILEHPIDQLIDKKRLADLKEKVRTLPTILDTLKLFVGEHYIKIPVIYKYKDKKVVTFSSCKVLWSTKPITIFTKNEIINFES